MRSYIGSFLVLVLLCGLTSCDVQKRLYRNGFYWNLPGEHVTQHDSVPAVAVEVENHADEERNVAETESAAESQIPSDTAGVQTTTDTSSSIAQNQPKEILHSDRVLEKQPVKAHEAAMPIRKDKEQAIGAGVAAAIFFLLGMLGLILKGTAPPTGVFIIAAFVCFIACVILASFLYPREPVVKQPKEATVMSPVEKVGIALLVVSGLILLSMAGLVSLIFLF